MLHMLHPPPAMECRRKYSMNSSPYISVHQLPVIPVTSQCGTCYIHLPPWSADVSSSYTIVIPPMKMGGHSFGVVCPSIPSILNFCLSGTISQYLLVRFNSFLVQMISTMDSRYPISLVKNDPLTLEILPLF